MSKKGISLLLLGMAALLLVIGSQLDAIPQPQAYHDFADKRSWLSVPNAWNVLSNIAFALAGLWGLFLLFSSEKITFKDIRERWPWAGVSLGLILTAIGSGYYHMAPSNFRLVFDRLAMTTVFMSLVAALIAERISVRTGLWLWPVLLCVGIYSVLHWYIAELRGAGDLRFYLGIQIFTILTSLLMLLAPSPYDHSRDLTVVAFFFGLAWVCEMRDHQIFHLTKGAISGHTLKHFAAAMAGFWLVRMLWKRKIKEQIQ